MNVFAVCVLQSVCCSVLQCFAGALVLRMLVYKYTLLFVCCRVLQCIARCREGCWNVNVFCSVCVAACVGDADM